METWFLVQWDSHRLWKKECSHCQCRWCHHVWHHTTAIRPHQPACFVKEKHRKAFQCCFWWASSTAWNSGKPIYVDSEYSHSISCWGPSACLARPTNLGIFQCCLKSHHWECCWCSWFPTGCEYPITTQHSTTKDCSPLQRHLPAGCTALPVLLMTFIANIHSVIQDAEQAGEDLKQLSWNKPQGPSMKDVTVKETLLTLVKEKWLYTKQKLYDVEPASLDTKNHGHYWACMELMDEVLTSEQRQLLQLKPHEQEKISDFDDVIKITAYMIEEAAFVKMKDLDGVKANSSWPTISGLGNRYSKYCKDNNIARKKTGTGHKNQHVAHPTWNWQQHYELLFFNCIWCC